MVIISPMSEGEAEIDSSNTPQGSVSQENNADESGPEGGSKEERKAVRYRVNWSARIMLPDRRIVPARTRDVSEGGFGFVMDEQVQVGTNVNIEATPWIDGQQLVIRAKGEITYSMLMSAGSGFSLGLKFTLVPPEHKKALNKALKQLSQS